ncbi:adenine-specific DNA-methyltransferase [Tissierella praeacuta]|uniref:site-specific DNA-methyltransferase n=1 Tax=Tissierella praeacuta TaxID=43131 RepID=UPI00105119EB|nr:site-specific DNA-methyltransferase [Tissierella praeacuta]TCU68936.1 adenine-specific DNA-methyltransferase [Tissierella praeacuta]
MDKLNMKSKDMTKDNIEKIERLFPNVITEIKDKDGNITKAIDFELLQQELSGEIVEGNKERYQLTWPGKKEAILMGNTPIDKTLRPVKEDSVEWDSTENLYIEGDNLEVLKLLQESYLNKIKCIYIDPPYNTGNDFIYVDDFTQDIDEYLDESGQKDEEGNRLFKNTDANGRYHSDWLTMMYPRLKLARNLLSEDGVIFISIDDNEVHNLRKICDEIFGEMNFRNAIIIKRGAKSVQAQFDTWDKLGSGYEYVLLYSKNPTYRFPKMEKLLKDSKKGSWNNHWRGTDRPTMRYEIFGITPDTGQWRWSKDRSINAIKNYKNLLKELNLDEKSISQEDIDEWYVKNIKKDEDRIDLLRLSKNGKPEHYIPPTNSQLLNDVWFDIPPNSSAVLKSLFNEKVFDSPKPMQLIKRILEFGTTQDIILDFFSGSATTAHAVMQLNAEDGGNRKYIMVQLPEETDEKSEAYKAGYKTIAEIGKERIRRAAKKIKKETNADIDYGFRVFKVDSSNMKDIYYLPNELTQMKLHELEANIKEDRTGLDLLSQVILEAGLPLSLPMETKIISGKEVYFVDENALIACFEKNIDESLIREIAKMKPLKAVFRDNSFKDCPSRINLEEIFKSMSPTTEIKVL